MANGIDELLRTYGRAWETRDADLVLSLFTEDASYQESPWSAPFVGKEAIRQYWLRATAAHREVRFELGEVRRLGKRVYAEWQCRFVRETTRQPTELRGILILDLDAGRIARLREYWLRRE